MGPADPHGPGCHRQGDEGLGRPWPAGFRQADLEIESFMSEQSLLSTLESLLDKAKKAGADAADAVVVEGTSLWSPSASASRKRSSAPKAAISACASSSAASRPSSPPPTA